MSVATLDELVLAALVPGEPASVDAHGRTLEELATSLDLANGRLSGQLELATTLEELRGSGLVETRTGSDGQPVFALTDEGADRGRAVRDRLADTVVEVVTDTGRREEPLSETAASLERSLVSIAAGCTDDGVYYCEDEPDFEPVVGRNAELERCRTVLERVRDDGTGRALFLTGHGGVGKTALAEALLAAASEDGVAGARASCQETGEPFGPIRDLLDAIAPSSPFDDVDVPADGIDDHEAFEAQQQALFYDVTDALAPSDVETPRLLVLDDLHLADAGTVEYLEYLLEHLSERPVALVGTYRPGSLPDETPVRPDDLAGDDFVTHLRLEPLDRTGTRGVVERVLERRGVPDDFVDAVHERTAGNPLFVEETVSALLETDQLDPEFEWYPNEPDEIDVPVAVTEAIDRRITALADDARDVIRWAAVIGDRVPLDVLRTVCGVPDARFQTILEALVTADIFDRLDDGEVVQFRSDVVRDAVLEEFSGDERRDRHATVAGAFEATVPDGGGRDDDRNERAAAIADHHDRAGNTHQAIEWYRRAGDRATDVYAHDAAADYFYSALKLARDADEEETLFSVSERLIEIFLLTSDLERAERYVEFVRERVDDPVRLQRIDRHAASIAIRRGAYDAGVDHATRGIERTTGPSAERCRLLERKAAASRHQRRYDEATELARRSREMAASLEDDLSGATAAVQLGMICLDRGDFERAEGIFEDVIELPPTNDLKRKRAAAYNCLGYINNRRNDYETALTRYERALDLFESIGETHEIATARNNVGILYAELGDTERALELYREVRETARRTGSERLRIGVIQNVAIAHLYRGDPEAALDAVTEAIEQIDRNDDVERPASVFHIRAKAFYYRNELEPMRDATARQLEIASENDEMRWIARAKSHRGTIARLDGDATTAIERHREAIDLATDHGLEQAILQTRLELVFDHAVREDAAGAREETDALEELANEYQTEMVALARGIVAHLEGRYDDAADHLERARAESDSRFRAFRALEQQARLALARGDGDRSQELASLLRDRADERGFGLFVAKAEEILEIHREDGE